MEYPEHAKQAYESVAKRYAIRYTDFLRHFGGWECTPLNVDGKPVGALLTKGPEIHACVNGGFGLWATKPVYKRFTQTIKEHGRALTSVAEGNTIGEAFVKRLGFKETGRAAGVIQYEVRDGH
jgi:hypothetical protein